MTLSFIFQFGNYNTSVQPTKIEEMKNLGPWVSPRCLRFWSYFVQFVVNPSVVLPQWLNLLRELGRQLMASINCLTSNWKNLVASFRRPRFKSSRVIVPLPHLSTDWKSLFPLQQSTGNKEEREQFSYILLSCRSRTSKYYGKGWWFF